MLSFRRKKQTSKNVVDTTFNKDKVDEDYKERVENDNFKDFGRLFDDKDGIDLRAVIGILITQRWWERLNQEV